MARPLRVEYPGAWYHILNRGRRKENIFFNESDYYLFMNILGECSRVFNLKVFAYSLMPNHYHLLICTPDGNLSRIMRHLDGVYTQKINRRYELEGSLFKGRFRSIIIDQESYLLELVRYIHRNPLTAYFEKQLGEHKWTSHRAYMEEEHRPAWLHINYILKQFSEYEKEAQKRLHTFVSKEPSLEIEKRLDGTNWPAILGGDKFKEKIKERLLGKKIDEKEIPQYRDSVKKIDIEKFLNALLKNFGVEKDSFFKKRRQENMDLKRGFIYACREYLQASNREIKNILGDMSLSSISKQYQIACKEVGVKTGCYDLVIDIAKKLKC